MRIFIFLIIYFSTISLLYADYCPYDIDNNVKVWGDTDEDYRKGNYCDLSYTDIQNIIAASPQNTTFLGEINVTHDINASFNAKVIHNLLIGGRDDSDYSYTNIKFNSHIITGFTNIIIDSFNSASVVNATIKDLSNLIFKSDDVRIGGISFENSLYDLTINVNKKKLTFTNTTFILGNYRKLTFNIGSDENIVQILNDPIFITGVGITNINIGSLSENFKSVSISGINVTVPIILNIYNIDLTLSNTINLYVGKNEVNIISSNIKGNIVYSNDLNNVLFKNSNLTGVISFIGGNKGSNILLDNIYMLDNSYFNIYNNNNNTIEIKDYFQGNINIQGVKDLIGVNFIKLDANLTGSGNLNLEDGRNVIYTADNSYDHPNSININFDNKSTNTIEVASGIFTYKVNINNSANNTIKLGNNESRYLNNDIYFNSQIDNSKNGNLDIYIMGDHNVYLNYSSVNPINNLVIASCSNIYVKNVGIKVNNYIQLGEATFNIELNNANAPLVIANTMNFNNNVLYFKFNDVNTFLKQIGDKKEYIIFKSDTPIKNCVDFISKDSLLRYEIVINDNNVVLKTTKASSIIDLVNNVYKVGLQKFSLEDYQTLSKNLDYLWENVNNAKINPVLDEIANLSTISNDSVINFITELFPVSNDLLYYSNSYVVKRFMDNLPSYIISQNFSLWSNYYTSNTNIYSETNNLNYFNNTSSVIGFTYKLLNKLQMGLAIGYGNGGISKKTFQINQTNYNFGSYITYNFIDNAFLTSKFAFNNNFYNLKREIDLNNYNNIMTSNTLVNGYYVSVRLGYNINIFNLKNITFKITPYLEQYANKNSMDSYKENGGFPLGVSGFTVEGYNSYIGSIYEFRLHYNKSVLLSKINLNLEFQKQNLGDTYYYFILTNVPINMKLDKYNNMKNINLGYSFDYTTFNGNLTISVGFNKQLLNKSDNFNYNIGLKYNFN